MNTWHTHDVENQSPELKDYNLYTSDPSLGRAVERQGAGWAHAELSRQGQQLGAEAMIRHAELANHHTPELSTFDRYGRRIDYVEFHPSWHEAMKVARNNGLVSSPYTETQPSGWVVYAAGMYMHAQIEPGSLCPTVMTQAVIPVLQKEGKRFDDLMPKLMSLDYDPRDLPIEQKKSIYVGMGMTEKQGGSDVRRNTTTAVPYAGQGRGAEYLITGHKWFFSAPMCDAHLVLANTENGLSCFFVPRWRSDGTKNPVEVQRLKEKVGNRSNSSSEVEFKGAWGIMVGEEGRGVPTIIEMATNTRLTCSVSSAGQIRHALAQCLNHTKNRVTFGKRLYDHPMMQSVLLDIALESEASTYVAMDLAAAYGQVNDAERSAWKRILTPAAKFWVCKRAVEIGGEAMEVFGGNGYVDAGPMGRLYREMPVNSIWEGSGNVMCLDVLRAISRKPDDFISVLSQLSRMSRGESVLTQSIHALREMLTLPSDTLEAQGRRFVAQLMTTTQACLLIEHAEAQTAEAFISSRFDPQWGAVVGLNQAKVANAKTILDRLWA